MSLDRAAFTRTLNLLGARVMAKSVSALRQRLHELVLEMPKVRSVVADETDPQRRLILLREGTQPAQVNGDLLSEFDASLVEYQLSLGYELLSAEEVLKSLLPEGMEVPASFETVGHLAHLNLRDEHAPYKHLIGQVILDKNPALRTVVNKVGTIDSTFRFFNMELLAGVEDTLVEVREEGCRFRFDYSRVYWNSRLQAEHTRLVDLIRKETSSKDPESKDGPVVIDAFCGVGPFVLPAAKRGCRVWANDLNPESVRWLRENLRLNRIDSVKVFNQDAREFIRLMLTEEMPKFNLHANHLLMNLPAIAYQFLNVFGELDLSIETKKALTIHCYCFCGKDQDPLEKIREGLDGEEPGEIIKVHLVRTVAPNKDMYCVSFKLADVTTKRRKLE